MEDKNYESVFNSNNIFEFILEKRIHIIVITFIAAILSAAVSLMIQPKYKSTVILFPTTATSVSQSLLADSYNQKDLFKFGEREEVEQMMQILLSSQIRDEICRKYNLMQHYEIDENSKYPYTSLRKKYDENIKISRTQYMSVEIDVFDTDPIMAANIANDISNLFDSTIYRMQSERTIKAFNLVEDRFLVQKQTIQDIQDSISRIHDKGVFEFESQSEVYNDQYAKALAAGNMAGAKRIEEKLKILAEYGSSYTKLRDQLFEEVKKFTSIETKYAEAKLDMDQHLPNKYVVNKAEVSEKKSKPVRWLIVFVSTFSAFIFSILVLILIDAVKKKEN